MNWAKACALAAAIGVFGLTQTACARRASLLESMDTGSEAVAQLLSSGADVRETRPDGRTPLHLAAERGNVQIVQALLRYGAPVDVQDEHGETPLYKAALGDRVECVEALLNGGARKDAANGPSRLQALHAAAFMGRPSSLAVLLRHHADPNAKTTWGETPLHLAARLDSPGTARIAELLLAAGADPMAHDARGFTPLHSAALGNVPVIPQLFVARGYELNSVSTWGMTPLDLALTHAADRVSQLLFSAGAVAKLSTAAEPPLHTAARLDDVERAQRIIAFGGDRGLVFAGKTAADVARTHASIEVAALLSASQAP